MPDHIKATQEQLAQRYGLSRQTALLLSMLVCLPTVTPTAISNRMGNIDTKLAVYRLRARLKLADEKLVIHNIPSMGYYLDPKSKARINAS